MLLCQIFFNGSDDSINKTALNVSFTNQTDLNLQVSLKRSTVVALNNINFGQFITESYNMTWTIYHEVCEPLLWSSYGSYELFCSLKATVRPIDHSKCLILCAMAECKLLGFGRTWGCENCLFFGERSCYDAIFLKNNYSTELCSIFHSIMAIFMLAQLSCSGPCSSIKEWCRALERPCVLHFILKCWLIYRCWNRVVCLFYWKACGESGDSLACECDLLRAPCRNLLPDK